MSKMIIVTMGLNSLAVRFNTDLLDDLMAATPVTRSGNKFVEGGTDITFTIIDGKQLQPDGRGCPPPTPAPDYLAMATAHSLDIKGLSLPVAAAADDVGVDDDIPF